MRSFLRAACIVAVGVRHAHHTPAAAPHVPAAGSPTMVVLVVVDQMRADYLDRFGAQFTGGFARLAHGGAVFTSAFQDQAITKTAPGHAAILSGRFPRSTGIITDRASVTDPKSPIVGGLLPDPGGASPIRFRGSALFDWLKAKDSRARALSVSRKDDAAILQLGRARETVLWYGNDGRFVTSAYYANALPKWVEQFNERHSTDGYAGKQWTLLLPESAYPEPDDVKFENLGRNVTFPHPFPQDSDVTAQVFLAYPQMDSLTAQVALEGVRATGIGRGPQTDLLAVSFSTTDAVGHQFGMDSRELHDHMLRLDRYLGAFLDSLYRMRDSSRVVVALTADHGMAPYPELRAEREHVSAVRVDLEPALLAFESQLKSAHVDPSTIAFEDGIVAVNHSALAKVGLKPDSVVDALTLALRAVPGVMRVDLASALAKQDTVRDYVARRWFHALPPDLPVDLVVTMQPYAYYSSTKNATHGTPHDYDAHVPLVFYGAGIKPGKYAEPALAVDIAPTLAAVIDVTPGERVDGHVLGMALRR